MTDSYCTGDITINAVTNGAVNYGYAESIGGFEGGDGNSRSGYYSHLLRCYTTSNITIYHNPSAWNPTIDVGGFSGAALGIFGYGDVDWTYEQRKSFCGFIERCWCEGDIYINDLSFAGHVGAGGADDSGGIGGFIGTIGGSGTVVENCYSWTKIEESSTSPHAGDGAVIGGFIGATIEVDEAVVPMYVTNYYHATPLSTNGIPDVGGDSLAEGMLVVVSSRKTRRRLWFGASVVLRQAARWNVDAAVAQGHIDRG